MFYLQLRLYLYTFFQDNSNIFGSSLNTMDSSVADIGRWTALYLSSVHTVSTGSPHFCTLFVWNIVAKN